MNLTTRQFTWAMVILVFLGIVGTAWYAVRAQMGIPVAPEFRIVDADPARGRTLFVQYGCGSCHQAAGVREARGRVAMPLTGVRERSYLAGRLPNTPDNMIRWIQHPQAFIPGTAMPDLGVTQGDARDIAAFLYTLR